MISFRPWRIRTRLTFWYAGTLCLALLAFSVGVWLILWHQLSSELDHLLQQDIMIAEKTLELEDGRVAWDEDAKNDEGVGEFEPSIEVTGEGGKVLFQSVSFRSSGIVPTRSRIKKTQIDGVPVTIHAIRPTEPLYNQLTRLAFILVVGIPLVTLFAAWGGFFLAKRALSPVQRMTDRAKIITADRLHDRLPVENPHDELGHLASIFNETFQRLESSFTELRRFTADASHELRTPLTALRSVGEVGLREPRAPEEYREIIGSMLEETDRLTRLVESLLAMSRADGGQIRLHRESLDLSIFVAEVVQQLSVLAEEKGQSLICDSLSNVRVTADRQILRQVISNLVDNAIKYSPESGSIALRVFERNDLAVLEVSDDGPGIAPEDQGRVFDRFYRADKARSRDLGGTGLGLAIVKWGVEAHEGRVELESEIGRGSTFRVYLPLEKMPHQNS